MEAKLINIDDFLHDGEGANGESLIHKTDSSLMLKLYDASKDYGFIVNELDMASKVYSLGVKVPKPGSFVTDGKGRYGILFQRLVGKRSFSRACGQEPERVEEFARRFARLCRDLHSTVVPEGMFRSVKECYLEILDSLDIYTPREREVILKTIAAAPDANTAIHGDLQFSNGLMVGDEDYLIDLGDFAYGAPEFDLGMVLFTCKYDDPEFLQSVFHMKPETASLFWIYFVKEYYGEDADPEQKERELRPYAMLKLLIMEKYAGLLGKYHWLFECND